MNNPFNNIKELINALKREDKLITEMFIKRKSLNYKYSYALELVDHDEARLQFLIEREVIRQNGQFIDLDDQYIEFFERVLDVNEEINIASINDNIRSIKENIDYYLNETNEHRKYAYLKKVKRILRKIGVLTLRNVIDLRRNIDNTFKNEPNYKIKKRKLENLDTRRTSITSLIEQTHKLIKEEELTFFKTAVDEELHQIISELKYLLSESSHNLIEIEKQIIDYLNQIKRQAKFIEKIRILKYLKDQFFIEADTDIKQVLAQKNAIIFENRINEPLKLSVDYLIENENAIETIKKIASRFKNKKPIQLEVAGNISDDDLNMINEQEETFSLEEIKNRFTATSNNLFDFIINYDFENTVDINERVTLFCQIASLYEDELIISDESGDYNNIEFAMIYPK